jgi:prepilin-type N-terminal cleavage/methylation domain-containing protein
MEFFMTNMEIKQGKTKGFTLIELSIVLVIIGLIVGGVLVGQDLIKAAELRATVGQKEKFDTAVNTFRGKYNGIPGDLLGTTFGLASTNATGGDKLADGDGIIESGSCSDAHGYGGENANFWVQLTQAGMIDGAISTAVSYTAVAAITAFTDAMLPQSRLGRGSRWMVTSTSGLNFYMLSSPSSTTVTTCAMTGTDVITPLNAYGIDSKIDDGLAATGQVISIDATTYAPTAAAGGSSAPDSSGTDDCYDSDTGVYAMTTATLGNQGACSLRIRTSF